MISVIFFSQYFSVYAKLYHFKRSAYLLLGVWIVFIFFCWVSKQKWIKRFFAIMFYKFKHGQCAAKATGNINNSLGLVPKILLQVIESLSWFYSQLEVDKGQRTEGTHGGWSRNKHGSSPYSNQKISGPNQQNEEKIEIGCPMIWQLAVEHLLQFPCFIICLLLIKSSFLPLNLFFTSTLHRKIFLFGSTVIE